MVGLKTRMPGRFTYNLPGAEVWRTRASPTPDPCQRPPLPFAPNPSSLALQRTQEVYKSRSSSGMLCELSHQQSAWTQRSPQFPGMYRAEAMIPTLLSHLGPLSWGWIFAVVISAVCQIFLANTWRIKSMLRFLG